MHLNTQMKSTVFAKKLRAQIATLKKRKAAAALKDMIAGLTTVATSSKIWL